MASEGPSGAVRGRRAKVPAAAAAPTTRSAKAIRTRTSEDAPGEEDGRRQPRGRALGPLNGVQSERRSRSPAPAPTREEDAGWEGYLLAKSRLIETLSHVSSPRCPRALHRSHKQ